MSTQRQSKTCNTVRQKPLPQYRVLLWNDVTHTTAEVTTILMQVFKMPEHQASQVMFCAHSTGSATCVIEPREMAELHRDSLLSYKLTATIEPVRLF
jgi:ATP-dependent Clp protease adapter protein ClpS